MEQVRRKRVSMLAVGGLVTLLFAPGADLFVPHQAGHPVFADLETLSHQLGVNPRTAVGLSALGVNGPDFNHQLLVLLLASTQGSISPGIVAAG